jgi:Alginate export
MHKIILATTLTALATPALAEPAKIKPLVDVRLRTETIDQAGIARKAEALTVRIRAGAEVKKGPFALLVEAEGTLALVDHYNSGLNGKTAFPVVADPQNVELNRLQLQFTGVPKMLVTVGRQRVNLDDQRFVGAVGWRANEQTFDAARIEWSGVKNVKADVTYAWANRTIWGVDGFGARQTAIGGRNVFANLSYKHKRGTLTGFAYLVDQNEAVVQGYRLSSQTYGARFAGSAPLSKSTKLSYALSYARQGDYRNNPNAYRAHYWLGEVGLEANGFRLLGGYEVLGSKTGAAFTSFQTPLATLHKFNGWADKFLTTPANGLRDAYATLGFVKPKWGRLTALTAQATYHDFKSARLGQRYGSEINLLLSAKHKRTTFSLKYADYTAKAFATDTKKFWASVEWAL